MTKLIVFGLVISAECMTANDQDVFLSSGQYSVDIDTRVHFCQLIKKPRS